MGANESEELGGFRSGKERSRLEEIAYEQGRRDADVDAHLRLHDQSIRAHEQRLGAINGSIARNADNTQRQNELIEAMREDLAAIVKDLDTRDAVEDDRETQSEREIAQRAGGRMYLVGVWTAAITLGLLAVGVLTLILNSR